VLEVSGSTVEANVEIAGTSGGVARRMTTDGLDELSTE